MMRLLAAFIILWGLGMSQAMAGASACNITKPVPVTGLALVRNLGDDKTYSQSVYAGEDLSFSLVQYHHAMDRPASGDNPGDALIRAVARQLQTVAKGATVSQITSAQMKDRSLGLETVLFATHGTGTTARLEAAAVSIHDECPVVWRFTKAELGDRNAALDHFMRLIGWWQEAARQ